MTENNGRQTFSFHYRYNSRIRSEHFGSQKYQKPARAICEFVANSLSAGAKRIEIAYERNKLDGIEAIIITDDGHGISYNTLMERFAEVGAFPATAKRDVLNRYGVGRFAVFRLGSSSRWTSVTDENGKKHRISFTLGGSEEESGDTEAVALEVPVGTMVEIFDLHSISADQLSSATVSAEILAQFCSFLLGHPDREIIVDGERIDLEDVIEYREEETIPFIIDPPGTTTIDHLLLRKSIERSRFAAPLLFCGKGMTIHAAQLDRPPSMNYLGIVQSAHLDRIVAERREDLFSLDTDYLELKEAIEERISDFGTRWKTEKKRHYVERARQETFYPYRDAPSDPITIARKDMYDVVLEKVHESVDLERMSVKQRSIIFRLLERVLSSNDTLEVIGYLLELDDKEMGIFRNVLEHTRLSSIIQLSSVVTSRLAFLDFLHELVYSKDLSKLVKERSQLHKILELNCWLFGQRYHLATSDKGFRTVIQRHRELAELPPTADSLSNIAGIDDIPDLFLAAQREYIINPRHNHLLVEIKSPSVSLGTKEYDQIRRYGRTIRESHEFDKTSTHWDLFLVSAKCSGEIDDVRHQKGTPHGCLLELDGMTIWAFEWSELITAARDEMKLVRDHLQKTTEGLSVSEYIRKNFPDILGSLVGEVPVN